MDRPTVTTMAALACAAGIGLLVVQSSMNASAHMGAKGVVKQRMDMMVSMGKAMKSLNAMVRGKAALDADTVARTARQIQDHGAKMTGLFPKGSMQPPTESRPEIWTDWKRFESLATSLGAEAGKLAEAGAAGDRKAMAAQFRRLGKVCSSCHKDFRAKKKR